MAALAEMLMVPVAPQRLVLAARAVAAEEPVSAAQAAVA
jgi:hypothetical protein